MHFSLITPLYPTQELHEKMSLTHLGPVVDGRAGGEKDVVGDDAGGDAFTLHFRQQLPHLVGALHLLLGVLGVCVWWSGCVDWWVGWLMLYMRC
jgi:hypothetical protein